MRIISGSCKGRKLCKLKGLQIRPTSDRVREAVFNILGQRVKNATVLDLFAGSGALGIEALSRGASHATFIDLACDVILENLNRCRFEEKATVLSYDLIKGIIPKSLKGQIFDLIFIDPPYGKGYIEHILEKESFADLLNENGVIIAEQPCKESLQINCSALDIYRQKKYSKTIISFINKI
ncbi:MAG: 16S rRNA (guanine(966)-N(2))-methyltransferase RsmD [Proteobacteria bacterium]|nr:16S rRNA (guanine(966)-N(2))-methyltransferase RsmD [Pseudomonadota bacterium]MBU1581739.1 16S rRNA (guanine(966)-N(2))-methyltransferase RsmD [Pseudomonadota bacterium]MBU2452367.1 16S rRNA (guanine(966)-N(2))-methyltransferase RsmD [Pseudomonadota bacterium]MBU2630757.1 16S rRNA (guanine(966)-N(2))-methyltransferase RsmD [Pseudomonadota bacterium]